MKIEHCLSTAHEIRLLRSLTVTVYRLETTQSQGTFTPNSLRCVAWWCRTAKRRHFRRNMPQYTATCRFHNVYLHNAWTRHRTAPQRNASGVNDPLVGLHSYSGRAQCSDVSELAAFLVVHLHADDGRGCSDSICGSLWSFGDWPVTAVSQ